MIPVHDELSIVIGADPIVWVSLGILLLGKEDIYFESISDMP